MAINIDRDAHARKEKIKVKMTVYEVGEQKKTKRGYDIVATRSTGLNEVEILLKHDEKLEAGDWVTGMLQEDGTYRAVKDVMVDYDPEEFLKNPFDSYVLIGIGEVPYCTPHEVEVDIHPGRHFIPIPTDESMAVIDFWNATSEARKLVRWDPEEEMEVPGTFDEGRIGEKLFPYVKLGDTALSAVKMAVDAVYNFDFDYRDFRKRLWEEKETRPLANKRDVRDVATLACLYLYEELCFENGNFAGLDKARERLEVALPKKFANYSTARHGQGNLVTDAETMFLDVHPAIVEICEKCILDKNIAIDGTRSKRSKKSMEFFNSLPEEIKEIVKDLHPIIDDLGKFHRYGTDRTLEYTYKDSHGVMRRRNVTVHVPSLEKVKVLKKKERELKAKASLLLEKHGIKGAVPPFVEAEEYVDPEEETKKKKEWIEGQKKRFCQV